MHEAVNTILLPYKCLANCLGETCSFGNVAMVYTMVNLSCALRLVTSISFILFVIRTDTL